MGAINNLFTSATKADRTNKVWLDTIGEQKASPKHKNVHVKTKAPLTTVSDRIKKVVDSVKLKAGFGPGLELKAKAGNLYVKGGASATINIAASKKDGQETTVESSIGFEGGIKDVIEVGVAREEKHGYNDNKMIEESNSISGVKIKGRELELKKDKDGKSTFGLKGKNKTSADSSGEIAVEATVVAIKVKASIDTTPLFSNEREKPEK